MLNNLNVYKIKNNDDRNYNTLKINLAFASNNQKLKG